MTKSMNRFNRPLTVAILSILFVLAIVLGISRPAHASSQPAIVENEDIKIIASFESGLDKPFNHGANDVAQHYWISLDPSYTYTPADVAPGMNWYKQINSAWNDPLLPDWTTDNINWWNVLGDKNGGNSGYSDAIYRLYLPGETNYENLRAYSKLRIKWMSGNPDDTRVAMEVFVYTKYDNTWVKVGDLSGTRNIDYTTDLDLTALTANQRSMASEILFRTHNTYIQAGNDYNNYQRNHLYSIKAVNPAPASSTGYSGLTRIDSKFLGQVLQRYHGSYSMTGFYDESIGKYRIWMGSGIPEHDSSDNVYYAESATMKGDWSNPKRITLNDSGVLIPQADQSGYGGDPTVIKVGSQYVMYFSGLKKKASPGDPLWNRIYRAVSTNGVDWTMSPTTPVVDAASGGVAGYGTGSPSVVYKDSTYYLYYYSQSEETNNYGTYLRTSSDGINFGSWTKLNKDFGGADFKYVDSLSKWALISYRDENQDVRDQRGGVVVALSSDGINFSYDFANDYRIAQDDTKVLNHNPAFIGDPLGHGWADMYGTYGMNEFGLGYAPWEYLTRQLGYSSIHLSTVVSTPTVPTPPTGTKYEAESGTLLGGAGAYSDATSSGGSGVQNLNSSGDGVQINSVVQGTRLSIRYSTLNTGTISAYVNGVHIRDIKVYSTGGWGGTGHYGTERINVYIPAGASVKLVRESGDVGINVDYIAVDEASQIYTWIDAENAALIGTPAIYLDGTRSNYAALQNINTVGNGLQFKLAQAANVMILKYASATTGTISLYINGTYTQKINFASTGGWGTYQDKSVNIAIAAGSIVKLQYDSGDAAMNLDFISFK